MKTTLYVLKRSNGCYGIYKNGKEQKHLISNSFLSDSADSLIHRILLEVKITDEYPEIVFTEDEPEFVSNLPKLEDII